MNSIGIFAGIGGFERGFAEAGFQSEMLCEIDDRARSVLTRWFPTTELRSDVRRISAIPKVDLLAAGFPCQNLSQAGDTRGIRGEASGVVSELFRLLWRRETRPRWIVLENVPFMLQLHRGLAMRVITAALEERGYAWAYRVIDARAFGLPQRRRRVLIVASREEDPRPVILSPGYETPEVRASGRAYGFYWTEGNTGLGWGVDCIPALKAGSTVSIPSPPAIWLPTTREIVVPDVRDAERLQGFPSCWTQHADENKKRERMRWRLVGNALPVPIASWIGARLLRARAHDYEPGDQIKSSTPWGPAGWGHKGERFKVDISEWPVSRLVPDLHDFLKYPPRPLSLAATAGFLGRVLRSSLRVRRAFVADLKYHKKRMTVCEDE